MTDAHKAWLLSFVSGQNFYNKKLKNSKDTEIEYIRRLKRYCDAVGKNPDELIALKLEGLQKPATVTEFQAEELLENYLDNSGLTPSVQLGVLTAVKSFYSSTRGRDLAADVGENIEVPEAKKRTPTFQDCLDLENAMTNQRNKFLVWFVESCPVRAGTLRKLKMRDLKTLDDKDVPFWISIESARLKGAGKGKYKGSKHVGFLHYYAAQKLEAYKKELAQKGIEYNEDSPLFMAYDTNPFGSSKGSALMETKAIFRDGSELAWKDLTKKRFSVHDFRDIISTVLEKPQVKANVNLAKPLTSHKPSGIEATYANHSDNGDKPNEDHLELFKMCLPFLVPETVPELKTELNEQKTQNATALEEMKREIEKMQNQHRQDIENLKEAIVRDQKKVNDSLNKFRES
jgi:hypothetical protein